MMQSLGMGRRKKALLLSTGQTTQYSSELDDGNYEKGIVKSYTVLTTGSQSGTTNIDLNHLVSETGAFTLADQKYTDAGKCGVFKAGGGETIIITGSVSNNGTFTTVAADANSITFASGIVNEADAPSTTFAKREAVSNNCIIDNNTGLMWLRSLVTKMGIAGDGKMPWTGVIYDIFQFCAECNAASLGGYSDWRVSNMTELYSILDNEAATSLPDSTAFPAWTSSFIYTSSTKTSNTLSALFIDINTYQSSSGTKTTAAYQCALVRG